MFDRLKQVRLFAELPDDLSADLSLQRSRPRLGPYTKIRSAVADMVKQEFGRTYTYEAVTP